MELLNPTAVTELVSSNPGWVGLILFVVVFAEGIVGVGYLIPAATVLFSTGALISTGVVSPAAAVVGSSLGATAGGSVSFWLGGRFSARIHHVWPFRSHPALLARNRDFVSRHGGKSVVLGRFTKALRPTVPAAAGMLGMTRRHFALCNACGALAWACVYIGVGVALGATLELTPIQAIQVSALLLALTALFAIALGLRARRRRGTGNGSAYDQADG